MNKLAIIFLLIGCSKLPIRRGVSIDIPVVTFQQRMERCMARFAYRGFNADGVVKICREIYKSRD